MPCEHEKRITVRTADTTVCPECVAAGDAWVHLRLCMDCGFVGCCDSSKNQHASRHMEGEHHFIERSLEPAEDWIWCRAHESIVDGLEPDEIR